VKKIVVFLAIFLYGYMQDRGNNIIIYPKKYQKEAQFIKSNDITKFYEKLYGYSLDKLYIGIMDNNFQIPNAFSTQVPFNETIFYNGGGAEAYFCSNSWLITLISHEIAHNFQTNSKQSVSKYLHTILGNNPFAIFAIIPLFTLPNLHLPTAILEGNSVLNESKFHNGGRLFSGELRALKNALIFGGYDISRFKNNSLIFPYLVDKYVIGGYFFLYLARKYGYKKVNRFFYHHSIHYINPFLIETSFKEFFGDTLSNLFGEFINYTKTLNYTPLQAKALASSKSYIYLSKYDKIYFITTNLENKKFLNIFGDSLVSMPTTLKNGKIFISDKIYTRGFGTIDYNVIKWGLFDENGYIKKDSIGNYYLDKDLYIDINSSFLYPNLYYKDKFIDQNVTTAKIKGNNIYYFKQEGIYKNFYKNGKKLFGFKGYYAKLVDVEDKKVYFIASTKEGSSVYCYDGDIYKLFDVDNIIDAVKMGNKFLVETIEKDGYYLYLKTPTPKLSNIYFPNISQNEFYFNHKKIPLTPQKYNSLLDIKLSYIYPSYIVEDDKNIWSFNVLFSDVLMRNMVGIYTYDDFYVINYTNFDIPFGASYSDDYISLSIFKKFIFGKNRLNSKLHFYKEDKDEFIFSLRYNYLDNFLLEFDKYRYIDLQLLYKKGTYGVKFNLSNYLWWLYLHLNVAYIKNPKVVTNKIYLLQDETNFVIESFSNNFYLKKAQKIGGGVSKTLYFDIYFKTFPLSIRRENISFDYNNYLLNDKKVNEQIVTLKVDTLFFYKYSLPIVTKYLKNSLGYEKYFIGAEEEF